jgi:hypothetical protein
VTRPAPPFQFLFILLFRGRRVGCDQGLLSTEGNDWTSWSLIALSANIPGA